jgi:hypothetical protein
MCQCPENTPLVGYENKDQRVLKIPDDLDIRYNAPGAPPRKTVCIDACLVPEIKHLWNMGIRTQGCCCGHNEIDPHILVHKDDIEKMKNLGYTHWANPMDRDRKDGFYAKSVKRVSS